MVELPPFNIVAHVFTGAAAAAVVGADGLMVVMIGGVDKAAKVGGGDGVAAAGGGEGANFGEGEERAGVGPCADRVTADAGAGVVVEVPVVAVETTTGPVLVVTEETDASEAKEASDGCGMRVTRGTPFSTGLRPGPRGCCCCCCGTGKCGTNGCCGIGWAAEKPIGTGVIE